MEWRLERTCATPDKTPPGTGSGRRGSILLVAIGVLAVLSILAIAFANLMHLESSVASSRVDKVRAEMAAESGFEEALQILRETVLLRPWSDPKDRWVFRNQTGSDVGTGIQIEEAVNPSIRGGAYPAGHPLAGRGYTRFLPSPDSLREVSVAVKIESNAGKLDLNGGELGGPPDQGYNKELARFLDDLVYALKRDPSYRSANLPDDAGQRILAGRPSTGFQSVTELAGVLGDRGADEIADFVTAHAWADPSTIRPDPMDGSATWGRGPVRSRPFALEAEPRAPIDMNLAARPVLIASLMGLSARVLERRSEPRAAGDKNGYAWRVAQTPAIDYDLARDVADSVLLRRESTGPFRTWDEFDSWLLALEPSLASLTPEGVDVIRAAVNPNTRLAKKNPDRVLLRSVDKSDLVLRKTEWTFGATGSFRIQSLGRVVLAGELIAQARLTVDYRLLATRRHTTQADFAGAQVYADDDVLLFPESVPDSDRNATEDGQIGLAPAPNAGDDASLSFRVPWRTSLDADIGNPKTPRAAPETTIEDFAPATVVGPGEIDPSNLLPDGATFDMTSGELYMFDAANNRNWIEGAFEFWFKPDHNWDLVREYKEPGSVGLIQILQPLADKKTTLVHQIKIVLFDDRDRPEIFSRLRIYTTKRVAAPEIGGFAPIPPGYDYKTELTYRYTTWFPKTDPAKPMSNNGLTRDHGLDWRQGIWHHVAVRWTNPTEHVMWIDG
ncbi:MAG: pilus assembly PilX N-terminal domain-containing protein, partial [Planctomycetes bacterium]|nr:pilus assembly PilX N-terminal domain-containing protein [Planctomycetota bacterium]